MSKKQQSDDNIHQMLGATGKASESFHKDKRFKTRKAFDIPGHAHELTFSTFQRKPFLILDGIANYFIQNLKQVRVDTNIQVLSYVVMPEHCHLLIYNPDANPKISEILSRLKMPVSKYAFTEHPHLRTICVRERNGRQPEYNFWLPGGGYDRNLWSPQAIESSTLYIHNNPVIRGLCALPEDWPWSSASQPIE